MSSTRSSVTDVPTLSNTCFSSNDDNDVSLDIEKNHPSLPHTLTFYNNNDSDDITTARPTQYNKFLSHMQEFKTKVSLNRSRFSFYFLTFCWFI